MKNASLITNLKQATRIAEQLVGARARVSELEGKLTTLGVGSLVTFTGNGKTAPKTTRVGGKRVMSPEVRAKIAAGQKARWAKRQAAVAAHKG